MSQLAELYEPYTPSLQTEAELDEVMPIARHQREWGNDELETVDDSSDLDDELAVVPTPELDPAALIGPLGEFVQLLEPHTEAHPAGLLLAGLAVCGAALGTSPHQLIEGTRHAGNLYVILTGPTSDGRKGTAVRLVLQMLSEFDPDFHRTNVSGGLSTSEGVIHRVRDADGATAAEPNVDPGIADKRLLIVADELGSVFRKMSQRDSTLSHTLREGWDGGTLRTLTRTRPMTATSPHIAIIGCITPSELRNVCKDADFSGGTLNRFLLTWVERTRSLPFGGSPDEIERSRVLDQLRRNIIQARELGEITFDSGARALWPSQYESLTASRPGRLGEATRRAAPYVLRLAMVFALTSGRAEITTIDLEAALAVWRYAESSAAFIFGTESLTPSQLKLFDAIDGAGAVGLSRAMIRRVVYVSNNVPAAKIAGELKVLLEAGLIRSTRRVSTGRHAEIWISTRQALANNGNNGRKEVTFRKEGVFHPIIPILPPQHDTATAGRATHAGAEQRRVDGLPSGAVNVVTQSPDELADDADDCA